MLLILVCWVVLMFLGVGFDEAFSVVVSSIGNVGPGLGDYGPAFHGTHYPMQPSGFCHF